MHEKRHFGIHTKVRLDKEYQKAGIKLVVGIVSANRGPSSGLGRLAKKFGSFFGDSYSVGSQCKV